MDEFLKVQTEMKAEQDSLRQELEVSKDPVPRKKIVTRALTERINTVHESLPVKIKPDESSTSVQNQTTMESLVEEIHKDPENTFPKKTIKLAVKRKYESERRILKESERGGNFRSSCVKKAKYEQRKLRAYNRRKSVVIEKEKQYYEQLSKEFMSEESDSSDSGTIVVHKHPWRSKKLNDWIEELDKRYRKKLERNSSTTPSKPRVIGRAATSLPPRKCPKWAVLDSWEPPDQDQLPEDDEEIAEEAVNEFNFD